MDEVYRAHRIHTMVHLDLDTDCWIPKADVAWDEQGAKQHQILDGPNDRFKVIDDAEGYAVEMARSWVDEEMVGDLTP